MQHCCCDGPSHTHTGSIQLDHHHTGNKTRRLPMNLTQHDKYDRTQQGDLLDENNMTQLLVLGKLGYG